VGLGNADSCRNPHFGAFLVLSVMMQTRLSTETGNMAAELYCQNCGTVAKAKKRVKGSFGIEVILWICFLIPGMIYSVWRLTSKEQVCPECGAPNMIPLTSPKARAALGEREHSRPERLRQQAGRPR
jgi:hypothetical protein